jgi:hypothetical protein
MAPKSTKPKIPDIPWGDENDWLVWAFITECEKEVNYKVLFGKKETTEVRQISRSLTRLLKKKEHEWSSKITVFKQIVQIILPDLFAMDGTTVANQLKGQLERYAPIL